MRGLLVAAQLLTRLPVPGLAEHRAGDLPSSLPWLPLVGALIGLAVGALGLAAAQLLPVDLALVLALASGVLLTGALHEDGLADTADGLFGGRSRERRLEIMRDSRVGSYGVIALVLAFFWRAAALRSLPVEDWPAALLVAHSLGRLATVRLMARLPYAREEHQGLAPALAAGLSVPRAIGAHLFGVLPALLLFGPQGALAVGATLLLGLALGRGYRAALGGFTGDLLGAACVLTELVVLAVLCG